MERRRVLKILAASGGVLSTNSWSSVRSLLLAEPQEQEPAHFFSRLDGEPRAEAEIRVENGGPRLYLNGEWIYPFCALSTGILQVATEFRQAGFRLIQPIIGLYTFWKGMNRYDWDTLDRFFADLLHLLPEAYLIPRLTLNTPRWWKVAHPTEQIGYSLPTQPEEYDLDIPTQPGGYGWGQGREVWEASWASEIWRRDTGEMFKAFIEHIESSPLKSRVIGYHPTSGMTGEWGYFGAASLPDLSEPMRRRLGTIPDGQARMTSTFGLLRNPEKEKAVIDFYRHYHETITDTILTFTRLVKSATDGKKLSLIFYGYVMESIMMQEIGYLDPKPILESDSIDILVGPYSYSHTNIPGQKRWTSDIADDAGNWLGRARGVGGDGGYRTLVESIRRHGKMFLVEMDPNTYLDPEFTSEGGSGKETKAGTLKILKRDFAQMLVSGNGGWLYDFGPTRKNGIGWYTSKPIIDLARRFHQLGQGRRRHDISSVAETASVYDMNSYFVTEHWKKSAPYTDMCSYYFDYINHWFGACQHRVFNRLSAPMDYLYRFDLAEADTRRYKLLWFPHSFYLESEEIEALLAFLQGSGVWVVWFYAPGFISSDRFRPDNMEKLTGFNFELLTDPGPMRIEAEIPGENGTTQLSLGIDRRVHPRFAVQDDRAETIGRWQDSQKPALAVKQMDGWTSVYAGAAPLPIPLCRWLARQAGIRLWSDQTDVVVASEDQAMLIANADGPRTLTLHKPMQEIDGGPKQQTHQLDLKFGDVRVFQA
ncbi:hypothetical protein JW992_15485 [candidate division KSB1 bacterium]|nr:hypothetical protein [candidate division KSB1 bacterium]